MIPIEHLPDNKGFSQRHYSSRFKTPFLKDLDVELKYFRSGVTLPAIKEDIFKFANCFNNFDSFMTDINMQTAIYLTDSAFRLPIPVSMLHLNDLFDYPLPIWNSSPGLPYKECGYSTKREVLDNPTNRRNIRWFWHNVKTEKPVKQTDCCAFVRSHLSQDVDKVRAVWGYPLTMTLGEAVFAVPLIEAYQANPSPLAYGYETSVGGMKKILKETEKYKHFIAIDFKDFDKTVQEKIIRVAFDILMRNVNLVHYRDHGISNVRGILLMWDYIVDYFIHTPIRTCDGKRFRKHSGVASGSYFTQLIDSIVNYLIITWVFLTLTGKPPCYLKVMGDDSIAAHDQPLDLDAASDLVQKLGMRLNIQKSACTTNIHNLKFLGFQINYGLPLKGFDEWVALLCLPEHHDRTWDDVATRALGLLYANNGVEEKFDFLARSIIEIRPFNVSMSRGMARYLKILGIDYCKHEPPSRLQFARRLGYL